MEKAELKNYRALVREVQQLREQVRILEASIYSPKGQRYSATPRAASGPKKTMDDAVAGHIKLDALYRAQLAEKESRQYFIEWAVKTYLDTPERLVMRFRYFEGRGWPAVVREMQELGYSERTVFRLHGSALLKLKEY